MIKMAIKASVMLAVAVAAGTLSFAQGKKDSLAKGNNTFSQSIDYSRPGEYHQLLANLAGEWEFKGKHFSPDSNKVMVEFGGSLVRKPFANGRFFLVEWTGGRMQIPIQDGKMIEDNVRTLETEGYDNVKRKFVTGFINNHIGSGINYSEGSYEPTTKTIFYETEMEQVPGKKIKMYEQFIIHSKDHYTLEYYRERNGRKYKVTELNCTRVIERAGFPTQGEFHKMLARSNGTWMGEATLQFSSDAPPVNVGTTSILINKMAMDGLYQVSEIKGNIAAGMGVPWTGVRITGYDDKRKLFTRAMIGDGDAAGGVAMEGPWDAATQSITMPFKKFNSSTGKERNLKEVYRIIDENTEILEIYATDSKTGKEFKMLNVKWTRKN
jgi:hypothetical protein